MSLWLSSIGAVVSSMVLQPLRRRHRPVQGQPRL